MKSTFHTVNIYWLVWVQVLSLLLFVRCQEDDGDGFRTYTIPEGQHRAIGTGFSFFNQEQLLFQAVFNSSARYKTQDPLNQQDNNKLLGFSDCNTLHQENSARFGWWWNGERVAITAYCYFKGQRIIEPIGEVEIDKIYQYGIEKTEKGYVFSLEGFQPLSLEFRQDACGSGRNYMLWPYFGGDETAPQEVRVRIKRLD